MAIEVTPVRGRKDKRAFVDLPYRLHAGTPWIPPLKLERYAYLNPKLNPFFKHGEAQLWLARKDGRVVGRITAQIDHAYNEYHQTKWGLFGFLEFEDDPEVVDALLAVVKPWLLERGCDRIVGPMDFVINEECGVLFDGFELEPTIRNPWHPPYYQQRLEQAGLMKAMDVFHWKLHISDREERMLPILPELAERAHTKHGISIRKMSWLHLRSELDIFAKIYNAAWSHNWGFTPYDKHDLNDLAMTYRLVYAGVAAQLYMEHYDMADKGRIKTGEAGWILETNKSMNRGLEAMGGKIVKRMRLYDMLPQPTEAEAQPAE
jgi:hypothetical protein